MGCRHRDALEIAVAPARFGEDFGNERHQPLGVTPPDLRVANRERRPVPPDERDGAARPGGVDREERADHAAGAGQTASTASTSGTKWRRRFWMPCFSVAVEDGQPAQEPRMLR